MSNWFLKGVNDTPGTVYNLSALLNTVLSNTNEEDKTNGTGKDQSQTQEL